MKVDGGLEPRRRAALALCRADAGLTLIEVLIVLAIIALFATIAAPQVLRYLGTAKSETARTQVANLVSAVELYYLDVGQYPSAETGLSALVDRPANQPRWRGPYIKKSSALVDPWDRPYRYRRPGEQGDFDIFSLGRDGEPGGEGEDADIRSW